MWCIVGVLIFLHYIAQDLGLFLSIRPKLQDKDQRPELQNQYQDQDQTCKTKTKTAAYKTKTKTSFCWSETGLVSK